MIRDAISDFKGLDHDPHFRWRGTNVTRIENLSDIAFAIALGMIISAIDAPRTFSELKEFLFFLVPTAAAFAVMLQIWTTHFTFFRRYGVADKKIVVLNAFLIFFVLYLAYPLRFTFGSLYMWIIGLNTGDYTRAIEMEMTDSAGAITICFFVIAYACCLGLLALMYGQVIKKRELLELDTSEMATTRTTRAGLWWSVLVCLLVVPLALFSLAGPMAAFLLFFQSPGYYIAAKYYFRNVEAQ